MLLTCAVLFVDLALLPKVAVKKVLPPRDSRRLRKRLWGKDGQLRSSMRNSFLLSSFSARGLGEEGTDAIRNSDSQTEAEKPILVENQKGEIKSAESVSDIESQKNLGLKSMNAQQIEQSMDDSLRRKLDNPGLRSMASRLTSMTSSIGGSRNNRRPTQEQLKNDFVQEMRHLAKLRHPCITTVRCWVLGACIPVFQS